MVKHMRVILAGGALAALAGCMPPDVSGRADYQTYCASCHGATGAGDGARAAGLAAAPPDLTTIAQRNDGVFPFLEMVQVVDGRTGVRGHGYPMPVWGSRFEDQVGEGAGDYGSEVVVRGRILSLVYFLESIQK